MLKSDDELCHDPPAAWGRWQDNFWFVGWDDERRAGFMIHAKSGQDTDIRVAVFDASGSEALTFVGPGGQGLNVEGFEAQPDPPFETWRIKATRDGATTLDLTISDKTQPLDFEVVLGQFNEQGLEAGIGHYQIGIRWAAEFSIGGRSVSASGLGVRDHSWGERDVRSFDKAWFASLYLEDPAEYVFAAVMSGAAGESGFGIRSLKGRVEHLSQPEITASLEADEATITFRRAGEVLRFQTAIRHRHEEKYPQVHQTLRSVEGYGPVLGRIGFGAVLLNDVVA